MKEIFILAVSAALVVSASAASYSFNNGTSSTASGISDASGNTFQGGSTAGVGFATGGGTSAGPGVVAIGIFSTDSLSGLSNADLIANFTSLTGVTNTFATAGALGNRGIFSSAAMNIRITGSAFENKNMYLFAGNGTTFATSTQFLVVKLATQFLSSDDSIPTATAELFRPSTSTLLIGTNATNVQTTNTDASTTPGWAMSSARPFWTVSTLSGLILSSGSLSPTFAPGTLAYTASVPIATDSITITPFPTAGEAKTTVNGTPVAWGTASGPISLPVGNSSISILVTAQDGVTTTSYTVAVTRGAPPMVSNIFAAQRAGTPFVDITYDVTADTPTVQITLAVSSDGGTTFSVPATTLSGAVGSGIETGTGKVITWNAGADWSKQHSTTMRFKVTAEDLIIIGFPLIPAGSFQMGNAMAADTDRTDAPIRTVTVSAFYMAQNLVTFSDWDTVRTWGGTHGYPDLSSGLGKAANHPVLMITWYDAVKWCNARSEMEGLTPCYTLSGAVYRTTNSDVVDCNWTANGYRLPTEAEWEKAARGGLSGKRFPWGDTISESQANYYGDPVNFSYDLGPAGYNSIGRIGSTFKGTSPVGSFPANGYGLYDMAGNAFEWCWDWEGTYAVGSQTDPRGAASGSGRGGRGGFLNNDARYCRVAFRYGSFPAFNNQGFGFRIARSFVPWQ